MVEINAANMAKEVQETFKKCLFKEGEDTTGKVEVQGITHNYGLHPGRLKEQTEIVKALLAELPEEFKKGWSFLNLCMTKDRVQWTGSHMRCEELVVMAIGLELMSYCLPRELWQVLLGGVPYVIVN